MRVSVVVNQHAKGACRESLGDELREFFRKSGTVADVNIYRPENLRAAFAKAVEGRPDAIVAGGGDGTISLGAEFCMERNLPLGVLMLGTRNHFGRDLSLPTEVEEQVRCVARGRTVRIDVGCVNGHHFINNSSIGAYPSAVEARDELRERWSLQKYIAGVIATLLVFARKPVLAPTLELDGRKIQAMTPFVFVGNNVYDVDLFAVRLRPSLTEGKLCVYTARRGGLGGFLKLIWLSFRNQLEQSRDFEMRFGSELVIHLHKASVRVSKDGEVVRLSTPLRYRINPKALEVFVS